MNETNDEIILEDVGDADNIAHRVGIIYAHFMKFVYLPANVMSNSWVNSIWTQGKDLYKRCNAPSEWKKAESLFYTEMKDKAFQEYQKDNDSSTSEIAFNMVLPDWNSISQFKKGSGPLMRDYILQFARRARRTDIENCIKGKDWVRFISK